MAIKETLKKLVGKVLSMGTPPEKEVLYKEVIKRKAPKKSAEALVIDDIKNSIKKIWTPQDDIEFARGTENPPVKKAVKKKAPAKKSTSTKKSATKKPAAKKETTKKPVVKKTTAKTTEAKKTTTAKKSTTTKKASTSSAKKAPAKKVAVKKSEESKKTATTKSTTTAKKTTTKKAQKTTESKTTTATKKPAAKKPAAKKAVTKKPASKKVETKTETTKKSTTKTTTAKKAAPKKPAIKKASTSTKKTATPKGSKRDEKIALYIKDIKKHYGEVDEAFVAIVVKNLGPSIYRKDAELVSCSDPKELDTVRRNFLMKKLGIDASKGVLDAAIQDVCTELKGVRTKYRATFYYALAKKFKKESVLS